MPPSVSGQPSDLAVKLRERLEQVRAEPGYSGITAGVAFDGDRNIAAAAGFADAVRRIELTPTSRMLAGSTGKTFVAAAILQAVDEGSLDLDSRIEEWIGKEEWFAGALWKSLGWCWNRKVS